MTSSADGLPHLWLPYTQMHTTPSPPKVVRTAGTRLVLDDGRSLVDGIASWWTSAHGYNHPFIRDALHAQLDAMPHVMFGGLTHGPAEHLAAKLSATTNGQLSRVFFTESGSVSVEVAMKMALQHAQLTGHAQRTKFVSYRGGYHGDTFATMSVCDPADGMHVRFKDAMAQHHNLPLPVDVDARAEHAAFWADHGAHIAAVLIEPLVQCAGGMRFHDEAVLREVVHQAHAAGALVIVDEIAVGLHRLGRTWAHQLAEVDVDILTTSKALTGGTLPLAATLATSDVFDAFLSDDDDDALMHGPTYMANPLACAAGLASMQLFDDVDTDAHVQHMERWMCDGLAPCRDVDGVVDVRVRGGIGVVELDNKTDLAWLRTRFVDEGVWVRPLENVVYLMPALVIDEDDMKVLTDAVCAVVQERALRRRR